MKEKMKPAKGLLIIGGGGHGRDLAEIGKNMGYEKIAYLDDHLASGSSVKDCQVIGTSSDAKKFSKEYDIVIGIGDGMARRAIFEQLKEDDLFVTSLIHTLSLICSRVEIGEGAVVMAGSMTMCDCKIGKGSIVSIGATLGHDVALGDFVHVAPGAHLSGTVSIGDNTWVGTGSAISNDVAICGNCTIGAGTVVTKDITVPGTYVGVPARRIK